MESRDHAGQSPLSRATLAAMHIAKKALCIEDDDWRDLLERVTGRRSAREIQPAQVPALERELRRLGWDGRLGRRVPGKKYEYLGVRPGRPTPAQLRLLEAEFAGLPGVHDRDAALRGLLRKMFGGTEQLIWLTDTQFAAALAAVRGMKRRAQG